MHAFFKSRAAKNKTLSPDRPPNPTPLRSPSSTLPATSPSKHFIGTPASQSSTIDELGRATKPSLNSSSLPFSHLRNQPSDSSSSISKSHGDPSELQLIYGYIGLYTDVELDLPTTTHAAHLIVQELKSRALETPLLFSTHALDIATEGTHSLIKSFVGSLDQFIQGIPIHGPHNLAALLKWILARHVNPRGGHGFIPWEKYASWRESEKAFGYPPRFLTTDLFSQLSAPAASLLSCLLDLFASASVRADLTGMTIHKCGALFGAYIFGLEDDQPFEKTYSNWLRYSHATEHLVFAYMRDLKATSPTGKIPLRMESCIKGYPSIIPCLFKTHPSARLERVARFRRLTGLYSKNLVFTAGTWNVPRSKSWDRLKPYPEISAAQYLNRSKAGFSTDSSKLLYSPSYKHLLNIRSNMNFEVDEDDDLGANFEGPQRFKTLVEKEWSGFLTRGFQEPDAKKLQFDLNESSTASLKMKRDTMDWDSFTGSGFIGRETYRPADLAFNSNIQMTASCPTPSSWPAAKKGISKKLIKNSRSPTVYPFDTTPSELPSLYVDENFFEAWADVLVGSGWCRDELKEVSWALVHCKCKPADYQDFEFRPTPLNPDGRNEDMWALFEELMPPDVRAAQFNAPKSITQKRNRRSFLRVITGKDPKKPTSTPDRKMPPVPELARPYYPNAPDPASASKLSHKPSSFLSSPQAPLDHQTSNSSLAFSIPSTPQLNSKNLFRSITRLRSHSTTTPITAADIRHPAHLHQIDIDAQSIDELSASCLEDHVNESDPWINVTVTYNSPYIQPSLRSGQSFESSPEAFKHYNGSASPSIRGPASLTPSPPRPSHPSPDSSRACTPTSDHDGLLHDVSRSSNISRSITSSSDYTVELAERLPERLPERTTSLVHPPSLIPIRSIRPNSPLKIHPPTVSDSNRGIISPSVYAPSSPLTTPRQTGFKPAEKTSLTPKTLSAKASSSNLSLSPKTPQRINNQDDFEQLSTFQEQRTLQLAQPPAHTANNPILDLSPSPKPQAINRYHSDQELALQEERKLQLSQQQIQAQQLEQLQKLREKLQQQQKQQQEQKLRTLQQLKQGSSPIQLPPESTPPQQKESKSTPPPPSGANPSPPSLPILDPALKKVDFNATGLASESAKHLSRDEDWFASLKSHVATNSHKSHHFSNQPVLPPQFDIKAKKVSNIVDLFEKTKPQSGGDDSVDRSSPSPASQLRTVASPVRLPVRAIKLSRVGEQDES